MQNAEIIPQADFDQGAKRGQWFAVRTRSSSEQFVCDGLAARNVEYYLPMTEEMRWKADGRSRIALVPMFTGYIFAQVEDRRFVPVLETPGVVEVVGIGRHPEMIPDAEIEAVRVFSRQGPAARVLPQLAVGQRVKIHAFGLIGFEGVVMTIDGESHVAVNIELLGRSLAVKLSAGDLEIVKHGPLTPTVRRVGDGSRIAHVPTTWTHRASLAAGL